MFSLADVENVGDDEGDGGVEEDKERYGGEDEEDEVREDVLGCGGRGE